MQAAPLLSLAGTPAEQAAFACVEDRKVTAAAVPGAV